MRALRITPKWFDGVSIFDIDLGNRWCLRVHYSRYRPRFSEIAVRADFALRFAVMRIAIATEGSSSDARNSQPAHVIDV
jgi:hypothetical protein